MAAVRPNWTTIILMLSFILTTQVFFYYLIPSIIAPNGSSMQQKKEPEPILDNPSVELKESVSKGPIQRKPIQISSERANAAIVILARNGDLGGLQKTIPIFEKRFNSKFNYPYVFLNDAPFTEAFKVGVQKLSKSEMKFGLVPKEHWSYPDWIDQKKATAAREDMHRRKIIYGGSLPYRHMCRYNSGFFFRHPLLQEYDYYWRVEPSVEFYCDIDYDPFLFMQKNDKKYGFVIMLHEYKETIPTLWDTTKKFMEEHPTMVAEKNSLDLIQKSDGTYNGCHFWSNFEIASLKFLRSKEYLAYFEHLDKAGGFFYERWGDAPVHSIAAAMFLPITQIHYFKDIGYFHGPFYNCPANPALQLGCECDPEKNVNNNHECYRIYRKVLEGHRD